MDANANADIESEKMDCEQINDINNTESAKPCFRPGTCFE